jgi:hypothetical protein
LDRGKAWAKADAKEGRESFVNRHGDRGRDLAMLLAREETAMCNASKRQDGQSRYGIAARSGSKKGLAGFCDMQQVFL